MGSETARGHAGVEVRMEELSRRYGPVVALNELTLTMAPGELVALLGPSGCGKTTALRLVAGLEEANGGRVVFGGKDVTGLPASKRDVGMVFQAYSLFPHMTAMQNVAFGLTLRRKTADERTKRAGEMLELVGLSGFADRYASQLSGGQQQRVALARALAIEPTVLLLDEPLSALDAKVRSRLRDEIRRVQLEIGITTLFVTHDQEEALAIADRVGVMQSGHLEQLGPPTEIYSRPATPFVAEFVGLTNRLPGEVKFGDGRGQGNPAAARPARRADRARHRAGATRGGVAGDRRRNGRRTPRRHGYRRGIPRAPPAASRSTSVRRDCAGADADVGSRRDSRGHAGVAWPCATTLSSSRGKRKLRATLDGGVRGLTTRQTLGAGSVFMPARAVHIGRLRSSKVSRTS